MGLIDKINRWMDNSSGNPSEIWTPLESEAQLDELIKASQERIQVVLKHSYSCGTSFFAKRSLETPGLWDDKKVQLWMIDVIRNRAESGILAQRLKVRHESPQLLLIKDGSVIWHDSHGGVNDRAIEQAFQKLDH